MLERQNAHRAWANDLALGWYRGLPGGAHPAEASAEALCLKLLSHVIRTETCWLDRLRGETPAAVIWDTLPADELEVLRRENDERFEAVLRGDLGRVVRYRRFNGDACETSVSDIVSHACMHGMYHRGQVAAHAARAGLPGVPATDFLLYALANP
ncbi:MAG TPA: DinB family protein [Fibrobacteria bacterium]|jgi:uncharacterized damage-inducible protein DinB|nr:DinB family protein [Fibrobacteria bacterium]